MSLATPATAPAGSTLPRGVLFRVFLRSLFLQAAWNPQGMQNLGLAYAIFPALKALYPDERRRSEAVKRHLVFFNTHPYVAAAIVGGVLWHEERIARGDETPERVIAFKAALMGPLAALGDGFFWLSLKPAAGALAAATVPILGAWAAVFFLVFYNLVHLTLRARLFRTGYLLGDRLVEALAKANLPVRGAHLRTIAAASAGGVAAYLALSFAEPQGGSLAPILAGGCLVLCVLAYLAVSRRLGNYALFYVAAALAAAAGAYL